MTNRSTCNVDRCVRKIYALGLCNAHYKRQRIFGDVQADKPLQIHHRGMPVGERLWLRSEPSGECILWTGTQNGVGYGFLVWEGRRWYVHRISWMLANGRPPSDDLVIDHLCRVRNCINPDHLDLVTQAVNAERGGGLKKAHQLNILKDTCRSGRHPWPASAVTYGDERVCRECKRDAGRRSDAKRRGKRSRHASNGAGDL